MRLKSPYLSARGGKGEGGPIKRRTLLLAVGDDWEGLYVNGELVREGSRIQLYELAEALGMVLSTVEVDCAWLEERGSLPSDVDDLVMSGDEEG